MLITMTENRVPDWLCNEHRRNPALNQGLEKCQLTYFPGVLRESLCSLVKKRPLGNYFQEVDDLT